MTGALAGPSLRVAFAKVDLVRPYSLWMLQRARDGYRSLQTAARAPTSGWSASAARAFRRFKIRRGCPAARPPAYKAVRTDQISGNSTTSSILRR